MRQLLSFIAAAIRATLRAPLDFLDALYEALRRKPSTSAADLALAQVEQAVEQAQAAGDQHEALSAFVLALEAEVQRTLAYTIVNTRRAAEGKPPVHCPAISDARFAEWAARLDAKQAQHVLNALKARPGQALTGHLDRSVRILGVPLILDLDTYKAMAAEEMDRVIAPTSRRRSS